MKKIFAIMLAAATMVACNSTKYTIKATDPSFADGSMALLQTNNDGRLEVIDSVKIENNSFVFSGEVTEVGIDRKFIHIAPSTYISLYLEPGNITITKQNPEEQTFRVSGTPLNDLSNTFNDKYNEFGERYKAAAEAEDKAATDAIEEEMMQYTKEFASTNIDNIIGQNLLRQRYYMFEPQELLDIIAKIPAEQAESFDKMKKMAEEALKVQPGNPYIDVEEKTPAGEALSLKSVVENGKNKYVLLDFWASWCSPCMQEVPYLIETYEAYHDKGFEIYGVSFDRDEAAWLKAIEEKGLAWLHVSALKAWDNQARADYAVNSIPANFLIDCSTGQIIATALRGEEVKAKIAELLD